jgi:hypothetical protein
MPTIRLALVAGAALAVAAPALVAPAAAALAAPVTAPRLAERPAADGARVVRRWGDEGHRMIAEAAARALPLEMPAFFRSAVAQLAYLNPEPDRWRGQRESPPMDAAMAAAYSPDHYVDLELLPRTALLARDRYAYADSLRAAGVSATTAGFLPYRILELTARLREEFRLWRRAPTAQERAWIEARILNDAGILGHYVADASNPHHTSIHHNGWVGANPRGYTAAGPNANFHGRFEGDYVRATLSPADFTALVERRPRTMLPLRDSVRAYLGRSHAQLGRLYDLEKQEAFGPTTTGTAHRRFAAERLAAGATALRDVWWTAWVASAQ